MLHNMSLVMLMILIYLVDETGNQRMRPTSIKSKKQSSDKTIQSGKKMQSIKSTKVSDKKMSSKGSSIRSSKTDVQNAIR